MASVIIAIAAVSLATPLSAQRVHGRVSDANTGEPLAGVTALLVDTAEHELGIAARTDANGRFRLTAPRPGSYRVRVMRLGYDASTSVSLAVGTGEDVTADLTLHPATTALPEVKTTAVAGGSAEFEERRRLGLGRIFTRAEIDEKGFNDVIDAFRDMPSARVRSAMDVSQTVVLLRAGAMTACEPTYFLNGAPLASSRGVVGMKDRDEARQTNKNANPSAKEVVFALSISEVQAIEVYSGASDLPAMYGGSDSACGAIAVWTTTPR